MKELLTKIRQIFIPFILADICVLAISTFINWFFFIEHQWFDVHDMIPETIIPMILAMGVVYFILRLPVNRLIRDTNRRNWTWFLLLIAGLAIFFPSDSAQRWLPKVLSKMTELENIKQLKDHQPSKYYTLKQYYIDKEHAGFYSTFSESQRNHELNMHIYVAIPILEKIADRNDPVCFGWLAKEYKNQVFNNLDEQEREIEFRKFSRSTDREFSETDFNGFQYLERMSNTKDIDYYRLAVNNSQHYNSVYPDVFISVNEPFAQHAGNTFSWIFGSLGIGAGAFFIVLLIAPMMTKQEQKLEMQLENFSVLFWKIFIPRKGFYATPILMDINIAVFLVMVFSGLGFITFDADVLLKWGANSKSMVMNGEWWRLATSMFLHGGVMHLLANMYGLLIAGMFLEPLLGKTRFAFSYICTGIFASLASIFFHDDVISVGASGAIFGLYGILLALLITKKFSAVFSNSLLTSTTIFLAYNLFYGFMHNGIDNMAHIGGLMSGFIVGFIIFFWLKKKNIMDAIELQDVLLEDIIQEKKSKHKNKSE